MVTAATCTQLLQGFVLQWLQKIYFTEFFSIQHFMFCSFAKLPACTKQGIGHQLSLKVSFSFLQLIGINGKNT